MKKFLVGLAVFLLSSAILMPMMSAQVLSADDFAGEWVLRTQGSPAGDTEMELTIRNQDGRLSGLITMPGSDGRTVPVNEIALEGNRITLDLSASGYSVSMTLELQQNVLLKGQMMGMIDVIGKRKGDDAVNLTYGVSSYQPACPPHSKFPKSSRFIYVDGKNLRNPDGSLFYMVGTNLGNWLNPEGYMFGLSRTNSYWMIDQALREILGPDGADDFWKAFKVNYITKADIDFIASCGANTIRIPFNYKLFTDEEYMGASSAEDGFACVDQVIAWCRDAGLKVILDMHCAPGGQTGDNIDNSFGYPWLFTCAKSQDKFCSVWKDIANHYKDEPVVLGYELLNEPIAHHFSDMDSLNRELEPLYMRCTRAIREVDAEHIIILGGAQWNINFSVFSDWNFDDRLMYTAHKYSTPPTVESIRSFLDFMERSNLPMYIGETGHNTSEWQKGVSRLYRSHNMGYLFWPYKKLGDSCMVGIVQPEGWEQGFVRFAESSRGTYEEIRTAIGDNMAGIRKMLEEFLELVRFENCMPQDEYIESMLLE